MDVTGVPSADSGHHSAIPDAVAVPWDLRAEQDGLGTAPITVLPTPTIRIRLPLGEGSGTSTCPPDLLVCTPALPPGGPGPSHAITTAGTLQDDQRNLRRTKDEIQDDNNARRLPTVYFLQYPTTVPRDSGENDDFHAPTHVHRPSL